MKSVEIKENTVKQFSVDGDFNIINIKGKVFLFSDEVTFSSYANPPKHKHDCEECIYIDEDHVEEDLYYCPRDNTAIARYGDNEKYHTSPVGSETKIKPLLECQAWTEEIKDALK